MHACYCANQRLSVKGDSLGLSCGESIRFFDFIHRLRTRKMNPSLKNAIHLFGSQTYEIYEKKNELCEFLPRESAANVGQQFPII